MLMLMLIQVLVFNVWTRHTNVKDKQRSGFMSRLHMLKQSAKSSKLLPKFISCPAHAGCRKHNTFTVERSGW